MSNVGLAMKPVETDLPACESIARALIVSCGDCQTKRPRRDGSKHPAEIGNADTS